MKKLLSIACLILIILSVSGITAAQEKATKEECVAKSRKAVSLIKEIGLDAAFEKISDKSGDFIWKDSYVFCFDDETAKFLVHPVKRLIGFTGTKLRDNDGRQYMIEMLELAKTKGEGWISYQHPNLKTEDGNPRIKTSFILKVPGEKVIVGADVAV
ncbi:MAG: cache domain-containing protein [Proteobacteria bacterium]|nr:cache domain-containing protein [Pseudomonadota bacterium]MBU1583654.1 cache domain-containing protein [Pseudomonadota bacterium]MBU2453375.1 cache domain-containing protein [Pseudomonadota bacterium]MBU2628138.1 cache domain-containing protein [Pseudomonadota bacterium]